MVIIFPLCRGLQYRRIMSISVSGEGA